jgi:hypothetical protein
LGALPVYKLIELIANWPLRKECRLEVLVIAWPIEGEMAVKLIRITI